MPLTVLLALFSMLAQGTSDFIYKKAQERGIVLESYLVLEAAPFAGVALLFGYLMGDLTMSRMAMVYGPILGVLSFVATFCFVSSLREGEAGINTLIFRLNFILVAMMAVLWLDEEWSFSLGLGLLLAILAIASVTLLGAKRGGNTDRSFRPIGLALVGMFFFALLNLVFKIGVRAGGNIAFLIIFSSCAWLVCSFVVMVARRRWQIPRNNWTFMPVTATLKGMAFFVMLYAFQIGGAASVVVPIVQLSFLVTMLLAAVFLRERLDPPKLIGLALALGAIFLLSR
jgi:uncharacterized membrane protein